MSLDPTQLGDIDWDAAIFTFVPTLGLALVATNCAAIWSAMAEEQMPPAAERLAEAAQIRVWRRDLSSRFKTIGPDEARALKLALEGSSFGEICARAISASDDTQAMVVASEILSAWLVDGIVCAVH
jgi:hypothetical protein